MLDIESLSKSFDKGKSFALKNVSFHLKEGDVCALVGESGSGKTTLVRLIAGLETPDAGVIRLNGEVVSSLNNFVPPEKRKVGLVFQDYALFPHMTALDNVAFGLTELPKFKRKVFAEEVLCRTGMGDHKHKSPAELSGGQQQRVALARAIAPEPKLVLLDEPFSNLDAMLRDTTRKEVRSILKKAGMSAVLVTHDQEEALSFADRIAVMNNGRIEQIGTPEEVYYKPKTKFVAQFLGRTNIFEAEVNDSDRIDTQLGSLKLNCRAKGQITCSIRPEHLTITKPNGNSEGCTKGVVVSREFRGHDITYHIDCNGEKYIVHTDNRILFNRFDEVVVSPLEPAVVLESLN